MIEESDPKAIQTNNPAQTSDPQPAAAEPAQPGEHSSPKATSNRRNAEKSTGPKTEQGKAWSRLNAMKHGILASQAVIATIEGKEERRIFEESVEGLTLYFEPVGCFEEMLVQQIAASFWRYRRLLQFENKSAFEVIERRQHKTLARDSFGNETPPVVYEVNREYERLEGVMEAAGLDGITLPAASDTAQLTRYEATIVRTMHRAVARLDALRERRERKAKAAKASSTAKDAHAEPEAEHYGGEDPGVKGRRRHRGARPLPIDETMDLHEALLDKAHSKEREEAKARREASPEAQFEKLRKVEQMIRENYQTKPNPPVASEGLSAKPSDEGDKTAFAPSKMKPPTG